jgi:tripartite-type tricarboxylate transporter receptor subunit TctC
MIPSIKANRVRGIAVTTAKRSQALPDIPAVADSVSGYEAVTWAAILGPKALPQAIVARLNGEINRILQTPDVKARLTSLGMDVAGGDAARVRCSHAKSRSGKKLSRQRISKWTVEC